MHLYVVNLARDTERMARIDAVLRSGGIAYTRFDAVDRDAVPLHAAFTAIPARAAVGSFGTRECARGELGCLLSHYGVWKLIAAGSDTHAAVFEDDVHISADLPGFLKLPVPSRADMIRLEAAGYRVLVHRNPEHRSGAIGLHRLASTQTGTAGYIISKSAALMLVERLGLFDRPIDLVLWGHQHPATRDLVSFQCIPALVAQDVVLPQLHRQGGALSSGIVDRPNPLDYMPPARRRRSLAMFVSTLGTRVVRRLWRMLLLSSLMVPFTSTDGREITSTKGRAD